MQSIRGIGDVSKVGYFYPYKLVPSFFKPRRD